MSTHHTTRLVILLMASLVMSASAAANGHKHNELLAKCPSQFYSVPIHSQAKLCQVFGDALPASIVYFVRLPTEEAIKYYLDSSSVSIQSKTNDRTLLVESNGLHRVVVSPDGKGSQIDILVITSQ